MDEADRPSRRATTKVLFRTGILFLAFALPAAALDVFTTELARRNGDYVELNPAGFVLPAQAVLREVGLGFIAAGMVLVGAYFRRDALYNAARTSFDQFGVELFSRHMWAVALIWIPFLGTALRYVIVISNGCYLTMGWSPIDSATLLPLQALLGDDTKGYVAWTVVALTALWYPAAALTVRSLYAVHRRP
jgi:hypothetical protein